MAMCGRCLSKGEKICAIGEVGLDAAHKVEHPVIPVQEPRVDFAQHRVCLLVDMSYQPGSSVKTGIILFVKEIVVFWKS